ncbi:hypothetical protein F511_09936 [Dorcoceras hygrometricum]|uniref:Uncharacterized protein n=1 Tax=Dorcoceras hygrometricum TaxID=472368 RepID=A0A2Z7CQH3_9LAMI|nr:hypothetical protein F511_09936 [Dorcoceras hygrometricum]
MLEKDVKLAEFVKLHEFWSSGSPALLATLSRSILRSYTSTQALTTKNRVQTTRNAHPKAQKKPLLNLLNEPSNSRTSRAYGISQLVAPSFQTSINGKSKSQGVQRHQERQKQRLDAMEIGGGKSR